ncbi:MAG: hypothetical protein ABJ314_07405 [Ilumatobacter sp.]|uniref:hypothetical protein n=1 Tax=Ilumatobacter sp. TaxID=1967498 RepID=UPI00329A6532
MKNTAKRSVAAMSVLGMVTTACGASDPDETLPTVPPPAEMRAPEKIAAATSSNSPGAESSDAASDSMIAPAFLISSFEAGPDLGPLPTDSTGYVFDAGNDITQDQATSLATALGLEETPVVEGDDYTTWWRAGASDGSAPSVTVYEDAQWSWSYDWGWQGRDIGVSCVSVDPNTTPSVDAESTAEGPEPFATDTDDEVTDTVGSETDVNVGVAPDEGCDTPALPTGLTSPDDAQAAATEILEGLGLDVASLTFETDAQDYSTMVNVYDRVGGHDIRSWGFSFDVDSELAYAYGSLAEPEPVGPYTLIDLDTALERLADQPFFGGVAAFDDIVEPDVAAPDVGKPVDAPVDGDQFPGDVAVEERVATLVEVSADLWWVTDTAGSVWLLPAYRFEDTTGAQYSVAAVDDDIITQTTPPVDTTVPSPADPDTPVEPGVPDTPVEPGVPVDPTDPVTVTPTPDMIMPFAGLDLDEFTARVEELGFVVRVTERDGESLAVTEDFSFSRVNVAVAGEDSTVVSATTDDGTTLIENTGTDTGTDAGVGLGVVSVTDGVEFYPACMTGTVEVDGVVWYPVADWGNDELAALHAEITSPARDEPVRPQGLARVSEPGPGDDVGTFVVWSDGVARFTSDSGDVAWLVSDDISELYNWVC